MIAGTRSTHWGWYRLFADMQRVRFKILLCAIILLIISTPVARTFGIELGPAFGQVLVPVLFVAMLLSAVFAVCRSRWTVIIGLSLALPAIMLQPVAAWVDWKSVAAAEYVLGIAFLGYAVLVILRHIFATQRITSDTISAALCIYLLLGLLWALGYSLLEIIEPGSFGFTSAEDALTGSMRFGGNESIYPTYYSFVTLSTLGYGDIVPRSSTARIFAAMEAVTGQLYLAVLVARLVGLHIASSSRRKD